MSYKLLENGMVTLSLSANGEKHTKKIREMAEKSPRKLSPHPGSANEKLNLWILSTNGLSSNVNLK